jgi:formylglycine-generating enzyme required for sulfatase activity
METVAVDTFPSGASPYGCEQMIGNVWEWTHSLYEKYPYQTEDGREEAQKSGYRVFRGGAFFNDRRQVRSAHRAWYNPELCTSSIGFRIALAPDLA